MIKMASIPRALGAFFLCCSLAQAEERQPVDNAILAWAVTAVLLDYKQTSQIDDSPHYYERNPLLGRNPDQADINRHFALTLASVAGISFAAPAHISRPLLITFAFFDTVIVAHNLKLGLKVEF